MTDLIVAIDGRAGQLTLNRPAALNALTHDMVLGIETALDSWRDADIDLVIIDAAGDRAFCSGGDIADMYTSGQNGDLDYGRGFWRDEYRLNAKIARYPKPVVTFLQGFTMGGGVGVGCHASHRIVDDTSQIAMPECGIGLVPDVGGSMLLAGGPGRLGAYLGITGQRMNAGDAIYAGFADYYVPQSAWAALKQDLIAGRIAAISAVAQPAPSTPQSQIDRAFASNELEPILAELAKLDTDFSGFAAKSIARNAPLAMACCLAILDRVRGLDDIRVALEQEYRFTSRAVPQGDFIEGIRAAIIEKDRNPKWAHRAPADVTKAEVDAMLAPADGPQLNWE